MSKRLFRKIRSIDDKTLGAALTNHATYLTAVTRATDQLLRERRLMLLWGAVVTAAVVWLGVR